MKNKTIYKGVITHMRGKQQDFRTEKYIRYGIRKFSFGAASVAIAVGLMFLGNGVVSATEVQSAETAITTSASSQGDKETEKAEPKAETVETVKPETVSPETIKPETVNPETVKPETVNPETVNSETMKPETVNPETEKATEVKSEVAATKAATKATLANTDASQADVDAQAETVSALSTAVTESNTAEKKLRPTEIYTTNGTPGTAGTAVKTNAKYANSVETVDNNKRGNRENTDSINQRRRVKRSAIDTTNFAQNYDRKVLSGSVTYPGFSVSDPDYPSGMWIDPDKSHYSYEWLQAKIKGKNHGNQIVFSTNRTGDGIVYVTELSESNKVLKQYTLKQNTKVKSAVFDNTTYYNDVYIAMVHSDGFDKFGNSFVANSFVTKYRASTFDNYYYSTLAYFVPKLITQTTYFVDKDGKQITDSNGNPVVPYTQKGLVGQKYTTSPILINGYYAIAPANSNGVMSPYGEIGASYVKDFHDGVVITYTQTGSDGTMSASIARYGIVLKKWTNLKPSDPTETYSDDRFVVGSYGIKNPYIPQTSDIKYVYNKLGNWIVSNPDGSTKSIIYPNDPSDPTKIADSSVPGYPVIDFLPGYTPKDHMGTPLVPVDPDDHTKGYIPPTPENPTEDTVITYEKDSQKATVTYVGEPIDYSTVAKLAELKALGYDLVTDGFTTATDKNFDKDTKVDQSFVVTVKPHVEPIKPVDPENPNDPNKPKPGDPIDPNNPDGPKWTEDLIKQIDTTRHVNRTITSVNEKGEEVAQKVTDKVTFTREGKINSVTGEITYGNWTAKDGDTTFDKVESPVVQGYILKDAKQKEVAATTGLTVDSKDENIEVVYTKLGSWVPKVPEGFEEPKLDKPQYPNDPTDPTKPGTPTTVIPQVPGTTPKDSNGNPLKPVDPNDPSKGYVPPTPENPTEDTVINYVPVPQPVRPTDNGDNNGTPTTAAQPASPSTPQYMDGKRELPNTGTEDNASLAALGLLGVLSGFGLVAHKKKED